MRKLFPFLKIYRYETLLFVYVQKSNTKTEGLQELLQISCSLFIRKFYSLTINHLKNIIGQLPCQKTSPNTTIYLSFYLGSLYDRFHNIFRHRIPSFYRHSVISLSAQQVSCVFHPRPECHRPLSAFLCGSIPARELEVFFYII